MSAAAPAFAQDAAKADAAQVEIRFNPPLDTPQQFRVTRSKARGGATTKPVSWIEELRFARNGKGFILYWHMVWDSLPATVRAPNVASLTRPFAQDPIAFDLDSNGNVLRARDWATVQPKLIGVARDTGHLLKVTDALAERLVALFQKLDAESAPSIILKNIDPVLGGGGIAMRVGETRDSSRDVAVPIFDGTIRQNVTATMRAADARSATIDTVSKIDPDSLRKLSASMAGLAPEKRPDLQRGQAAIQQLSVVDTTSMTVDRASGLPIRLENRRVTQVEGVEQIETLLIEWIQ
jgi:hypothetical protein